MRLLCVIPSYWPAFKYGGVIFSVHRMNKALSGKGVDVTVYTTNVGLEGKLPINREVGLNGIKITYFAYAKFLEFLGDTGYQFSVPLTRALRKMITTFDLVYIVSIWNYPTKAAAFFCAQFGIPYIIAPQGSLYPYTISKKAWKKMPYYHLLAKKALKSAHTIHYISPDEAEKCHKFLGLKNQEIIVPNGIDLSEFEQLPAQCTFKERFPFLKNKKVILFLGRINWIKGLDILIKAYSQLTRMQDDLHLVITGNDEAGYIQKVRKWINNYGLVDKVTFTGMLLGGDKLQAYVGSDLFVLPSYSENFGMTVVEAMASGLPVVISNKVGIHKEVEKNKAGIIVDTKPESLLKGMKTLLDNQTLRKKTAEKGKLLVRNYYDIDKIADRMKNTFEGIIRNVG